MRLGKPLGLIAGFHAEPICDELPELTHGGEQWAPAMFGIDRHQHEVWELYLQLDGFTVWEIPNGQMRVPAGHLLAMPPRVTHTLISRSERHHFAFLGIDVDRWTTRIPSIRGAWGARSPVTYRAESLRSEFRNLVSEIGTARRFRTEAIASAVDRLMIETTRIVTGEQEVSTPVSWSRPVTQVEALLRTRPHEPWRLDTLARLTSMSPNHLAKLFRDQVGMPPHQYLLRERLTLAQELLRNTELTVGEVALESGFGSSQRFAKAFRNHYGCTASEFRERLLSIP